MGWTKITTEPFTFCTFASDIEAFCESNKRQVRCPQCGIELTVKEQQNAKVVRDGEEIAEFRMVHKCGARLIVLND